MLRAYGKGEGNGENGKRMGKASNEKKCFSTLLFTVCWVVGILTMKYTKRRL